jgi:enoyl-CoA hydratase
MTQIQIEKTGRVARVTLASPNKLNPLTDPLIDELGDVLAQLEADDGIHVSILFGSAKAFAAGADIATMETLDYAKAFRGDYIARNWERIRTHRKPIIAAVHGYALGGGCELAMMCDVIIASESAIFGQPEILLGIVPGAGGTQRLPRAVGKSSAMEMCLSGRSIDASRALQIGLVSRVVPNDILLDEASALAETMAANSLPVLMAVKESVNRSFESSLAEGLMFERRSFHAGFALSDQKEGMRAFLQKRPASFSNE